jgi:hypothetical protein
MKYALLIYGDEAAFGQLSQDAVASVMEAYSAFDAEVAKRGVEMSGEALRETTTATTVRIRDGKILTTDGPFAETKEQLGGFFVIDVKDLDEAIEIAAKIPGALDGSIEVRPVWVFE